MAIFRCVKGGEQAVSYEQLFLLRRVEGFERTPARCSEPTIEANATCDGRDCCLRFMCVSRWPMVISVRSSKPGRALANAQVVVATQNRRGCDEATLRRTVAAEPCAPFQMREQSGSVRLASP